MISAQRTASQKGTQSKEASFSPTITMLENIMIFMLQYDSAKTLVVENQLYALGHYYDTGVTFGFNSQMYIAHKKVWLATGGQLTCVGIPIAAPVVPVTEPVTPTEATGDIVSVTGTTATEAGAIVFYVHGEKITTTVPVGMTPTEAGAAILVQLAGNTDILLTGFTNTTGVVAATATFGGTTGNDIRITGPKSTDAQTPAGLTVVLADPTEGAGDESESLQDAYNAFILDTTWQTDIITPVNTTTALDLALANIGLPDNGSNQGTGLWADAVQRPCTNWVGSIDNLVTATALAEDREEDPDNIIVCAPDRMEMPFVIAAVTAARLANDGNSNPAAAPRGQTVLLDGPVSAANDWTIGANGENNKQSALDAGLAIITQDESGNSVCGDIATCYRPTKYTYPAWQFENNKRKGWNMNKSLKDDKAIYDNRVFVESKEEAISQPLAADSDSYRARVVQLAILWKQYGLAYNSSFTIANMLVALGEFGNPDRIGRYIPTILSGNARVQSDTLLVGRTLSDASLTDIDLTVG